MKGKVTVLVAIGALAFASGALAAMVDGTSGNDHLRGTMQADVIRAFAGDDFVNARAGNDLVRAGGGADAVQGDRGSDIVFGGPGSDRLDAGGADDVVWAGSGDDAVSGASTDVNNYKIAVKQSAAWAQALRTFFDLYDANANALYPADYIITNSRWGHCSPDSYSGTVEGAGLDLAYTYMSLRNRGFSRLRAKN